MTVGASEAKCRHSGPSVSEERTDGASLTKEGRRVLISA